MTTDTPVLYSYWRSSCSWRVRIALAHKGIEYEYKAVHLVKNGGEQYQDEFSAVNPNQRVPTLVIDGHAISQSSAILEYLEETRPEKPLLPKDPATRAKIRNVCQIIGADIQPIQNLAVMNKAVEALPESEQGAKKIEWGRYWVERGFIALEKELQKTAGAFCVGDTVTLADLFLEPQVYNANRFNVDMSKFPTIARISKTLAELPAFQAAHPSQQPDAQ
ncbi:hypothetical protein PINS_up019335 [Pythium insidiosum]|nr:hypothetical protein PINS_up001604 [Pythium insidiosum]GLE08284.1 hypothetical protein PINS_up019335 [Pythium insidiosum]